MIDKVNVFICFDEIRQKVGQLVRSGREIYFRYDEEFIHSGLEISPFKLPLNKSIVKAEFKPFEGLFGVFNDSLPDGWGRLLLDRMLSTQGVSVYDLSPLDRLTYVGQSGMGALMYEPEVGETEFDSSDFDLDYYSQQTNEILRGGSSDIIQELHVLGGSSGGARPKVNVGYNQDTGEMIHGKDNLSEDFQNWMIKFPSSMDIPDIANVEMAYHRMAIEAGIEMSECQLFHGKEGKPYFGTKRFDRAPGKRLHLHSASGLMHDDFRYSTMDYGHLMDCAFRLEKSVKAYEKVIRLAAFNVFGHNRDDHSKNFSFLMDAGGMWRFSPAYDLVYSFSSHGHHSTTISGEGKVPGKKELLELAKHFGVRNIEYIIDEVKEPLSKWVDFANDNGVEKGTVVQIKKNIEALLKL